MFIGLISKISGRKDEPTMAYFDVHRIIKIADNPNGEGVMFWFCDGDVGGAMPYEAISYDCGGLIELVMQARLHPAQMLPSNNVGKGDDGPARESTGSLHWSAKDNR